MNRAARFLSRLWLVLTAIWWASIVAVLLSAGVAFEVPDDLKRWSEAKANEYNLCDGLTAPEGSEASRKCWQAMAEVLRLQKSANSYSPPGFVFHTLKERATLAAVFVVPSLLVYSLGAALFWVCRPLAEGRKR
jgi:hypothetical protein